MMREGTYRLTRDVANLTPDRRIKQQRATNWRQWTTWPEGSILLVTEDPEFKDLRIHPRGGYRMDALRPRDAAYNRVMESLERIDETPSDLLRRLGDDMAGGYALMILDKLLTTCGANEMLALVKAEEDAALDAEADRS